MILELASDNPLHTLIRIPGTDNVLYRITSVQNLNHLNDLLGWTTTLSTPLSSGSSVSSKGKTRRDVATIVWDHDGETIAFAESQAKISSHLVFDFQQRSQRPLEIEVREDLAWKGDMNGLHLMEKNVAVATLRPCRRFIHGRLVRKVMQRFDELDVSDDIINRVGLNTIIATFTVITTARQRRFGIVPRRASIPDSSDSESVGSSVEYEDLVEPNSSEDDSQYDSEDPDAPSPHYSPPGTSHGAPVQASYTFTPTTVPSDDTTPRANQSGFDDVLIVNPESRRPSAQSGVDVGFENDFNPNAPPSSAPSKFTSNRFRSSNKSRGKDKEKSDSLGPLPSALASLGLGIRSGRRRSAADPSYATEESEQRLKKWGRSRGLSF
ncbi:hypothetical protein FRC12_002194 [Ceratobasidium sp. 428]|nr:hypothetical protein FRC09_012335 [Ceratobasidium sp. 395]KAG8774038.1 hypothetical protein FRC12_002194 [Ceratobasidium sp. 428]